MIFCGQCGLQLTQGSTRCPRCGATVEETKVAEDALHANDQTIASPSLLNPSQAEPVIPGVPPQQLVLRPGTQTGNYDPQDATSVMEAPAYNTHMPPGGTLHAGSGHYPSQASYPNYTMPAGTYAPAGVPSPGMSSQAGYAPQQDTGNSNHTLRVAGLTTIFLGLLLILSALVLFAMQHNGML